MAGRPRGRGSSKLESRNDPAGLSLQLLRAQEEERKRISRELHDETGQGLMVLRLVLSGLREDCAQAAVQSQMDEAIGMLDRTIGDLRRIIARLSPRALDELGLLGAIRKEAREVARLGGVRATLLLGEDVQNLDHELEIAIYRAVQESLNNVMRHAQAKNLIIRLEKGTSTLALKIEDDGIGLRSRGGPGRGFGLFGMRERVAALGGKVRIRSREGVGTQIKVTLPVSDRSENENLVHREKGRSHARKRRSRRLRAAA